MILPFSISLKKKLMPRRANTVTTMIKARKKNEGVIDTSALPNAFKGPAANSNIREAMPYVQGNRLSR